MIVSPLQERDELPPLASAVRSWGDDTARYKGKEMYQEVLLDYLDRKHAEQIAKGIVSSDADPENKYPW